MSQPEYMRYDFAGQAVRPLRRLVTAAILLGVINLVAVGLIVALLFAGHDAVPTGAAHGWTPEQQRALAARLRTDGLRRPAIEAFATYFALPALTPSERANAAYSAGALCFEDARFDAALDWFYRVELADRESPLRDQANAYIVQCLERLGRTLDAQYALDRSTTLDRDSRTNDSREVVVARVGDDTVTRAELHAAIQELPPAQQRDFTSRKGRREFLDQMIVRRLLLEKGLQRGVASQPEIAQAVRGFEENAIVATVMDSELAQRVHADPDDVRLYYDAHRDRYTEPARAALTCLLYDSEDKARAALTNLLATVSNTTLFAELRKEADTRKAVVAGEATATGFVTGLGNEPRLATPALAADVGLLTNTIATARGHAVVRVDRRIPAAARPFEEVRAAVERAYRSEKEQQVMQLFVQELLSAARVQVFDDRLDGGPATPKTPAPGVK
jgi:tetratricopeptide (TPR) repeat protein